MDFFFKTKIVHHFTKLTELIDIIKLIFCLYFINFELMILILNRINKILHKYFFIT